MWRKGCKVPPNYLKFSQKSSGCHRICEIKFQDISRKFLKIFQRHYFIYHYLPPHPWIRQAMLVLKQDIHTSNPPKKQTIILGVIVNFWRTNEQTSPRFPPLKRSPGYYSGEICRIMHCCGKVLVHFLNGQTFSHWFWIVNHVCEYI